MCNSWFNHSKNHAFRYISRPDGEKITAEWIKSGNYEIEVMGKKYQASVHLRSPFDPENKRLRGIYDEPLPVRKAFAQ